MYRCIKMGASREILVEHPWCDCLITFACRITLGGKRAAKNHQTIISSLEALSISGGKHVPPFPPSTPLTTKVSGQNDSSWSDLEVPG